MKVGNREADGEVAWARCDHCGREFPVFLPTGESDSGTQGIVGLTSREKKELYITELSVAEARMASEDIQRCAKECEHRTAAHLARTDLRMPLLLEEKQANQQKAARTLAFQAFLKIYKPPVVSYLCIFCEQGKATVERSETVESFIEDGGAVSASEGSSS